MKEQIPVDARLKQLAFPLNVFACATHLQEGHVDYLHYGLFDLTHSSIQTAQRQSTELILQRLPKTGSRILEIGVGLGTTAKTLGEQGYLVTGISPDSLQISIARERAQSVAQFEVTMFEDYSAPPESFDLILLQESSQYMDPLVLFSKAHRLLDQEGCLLVLDQIALRRIHPGKESLHLGTRFANQAERQGFVLKENLDLSKQASPTIDYILKIIGFHKKELLKLLEMNEAGLVALIDAIAANRQRYRDSIIGYGLYHFVKK